MLQTIRLHIPRFVDHPFTEIRNELNIANICSPGIVLSCCTPRTNNESTFLYVRSLVLLFLMRTKRESKHVENTRRRPGSYAKQQNKATVLMISDVVFNPKEFRFSLSAHVHFWYFD